MPKVNTALEERNRMKEIPALRGASSHTQKSPCSGHFGFGLPAIHEAADPPLSPTFETQKYGQADGSVAFFSFINKNCLILTLINK